MKYEPDGSDERVGRIREWAYGKYAIGAPHLPMTHDLLAAIDRLRGDLEASQRELERVRTKWAAAVQETQDLGSSCRGAETAAEARLQEIVRLQKDNDALQATLNEVVVERDESDFCRRKLQGELDALNKKDQRPAQTSTIELCLELIELYRACCVCGSAIEAQPPYCSLCLRPHPSAASAWAQRETQALAKVAVLRNSLATTDEVPGDSPEPDPPATS